MDSETSRVLQRIAMSLTQAQRLRGLSTADLAERSGMDVIELQQVLDAEIDLPLPAIYRIAGALEVAPAYLLQGIEWIPGKHGQGRFRLEEPDAG